VGIERSGLLRAMALVVASEQILPVDKGKEKVLFSESEPQSRNFDDKSTSSAPHVNEAQLDSRDLPRPTNPPRPPRLPHLRTIPPFIAEHDIPRGVLFALQMFLGYLLMLAVM